MGSILERATSGHLRRRASGHLGRRPALPDNTIRNGFAYVTHEYDAERNNMYHRWVYTFYDCPITYGIVWTDFGTDVYGYLGLRSNATANGIVLYSAWHYSCIDIGTLWYPYSTGLGSADRLVITFTGSGANTVWRLRGGNMSFGSFSSIRDFGTITGTTPDGEYSPCLTTDQVTVPNARVYI